MEPVWNSLEVVKIIVSILTPLTIVFLGYWINLRLKHIETSQQRERDEQKSKEDHEREERRQHYEERKETERLEREERKNEIERRYQPHIEFKIDCQFFGSRENQFLINFLLIADNRGHVLHRFPKIKLRVRGIKNEEPFEYWEGREPRARFPHKILDVDVVPPKYNFIFVEPGVAQRINYPSIVSADYSFLVARAEFHYDKFTPHSVEDVFTVPLHRGNLKQ